MIFSLHSDGTKMYQDLKKCYWWHNMKWKIENFVSKCLICQQIKAPRHRPVGLLQPLSIPKMKVGEMWQWISLKNGLEWQKRCTMIWVVVDRLTKTTPFIPEKPTYPVVKWAQLFMNEIVRFHGVPVSFLQSIGVEKSLSTLLCDGIHFS